MNEIWKDIEGYKGYYQISSLGQVKRLEGHMLLIMDFMVNIKFYV